MTRHSLALIALFALAAPRGFAQPAEKPRASLVVVTEDEPVETPPVPQGEERRAIGARILDNSGPVRECYEKRLHDRPSLQGKLVARFDIGPGGKVIGASAEGMNDRELSACVLAAVRKLEFDKPRSGGKLRVAYPFRFEPRASK
ncbi:MAG TPA: AgmX/PglI C-terminal domain-containing protein [Myxococcales bacterium]|nr:AgmX/PglI C-terminal domain-containing protein [Myxococcales bacterium]